MLQFRALYPISYALVLAAALLGLTSCPSPVITPQTPGGSVVATPSISPTGSTISSSQVITLSTSTPAASIRYTIDGIAPSATSGTLYSSSFTLSAGNHTVRAIAYKSGLTNSSIATRTFAVSTLSPITIEAENATLSGTSTATSLPGYSGSGYVSGFDSVDTSDKVSFTVNSPIATSYLLTVRAMVQTSMGSAKTNDIFLNGSKVGDFSISNNSTWTDAFNQVINLNAGNNSLVIQKNWGYFELDKITLNPSTSGNQVESLSNGSANDITKRLYAYLLSLWANKTLSGQMDLCWDDTINMAARVFDDTGKYPAIMGYDFMNIESSSGNGTSQHIEAKAWWDAGGIVTFCWHLRDPSDVNGGNFYTTDTSFRIPMNTNGTLNTSSTAFNQIKAKVDLVATKLAWLQSNGVPVLWRPLHEAYGNDEANGGGWFWWGATRSDGVSRAVAFKALWNWMYSYLTVDKGLNNLIWVWNGQHSDWYPGNATVDIIGEDVYATASPRDYSSQKSRFDGAVSYPANNGYSAQSKMVALTENGPIPLPTNMSNDNARWLWFLTWNDKNASTNNTKDEYFWSSTYYNELSHKQGVYTHSNVITRDELPDLSEFPID